MTKMAGAGVRCTSCPCFFVSFPVSFPFPILLFLTYIKKYVIKHVFPAPFACRVELWLYFCVVKHESSGKGATGKGNKD